jgi:hypothetical protein
MDAMDVGGNLLGDKRRLRPRPSLLAGTAWRGYFPGILPTTRLLTDRRHGVDRRAEPRRLAAVARLRRALEFLEKRH